ncbi:hypothetical protein J6590_085074 [Homalodisca vitripennis]|nr:hypothetical protein J6590_085074 [Homalodisca vitripennis]
MSVKQLAHKTGRIDGSKISDFESELEIAQIQILYITLALYIGTIDLALYRVSTFFCFLRSSLRLVAHNDDNIRRIVLSSRKNIWHFLEITPRYKITRVKRPSSSIIHVVKVVNSFFSIFSVCVAGIPSWVMETPGIKFIPGNLIIGI